MRRSVTARAVGEALSWLSPDRLAELPEILGRSSRRLHLRRADRKFFAYGFYQSVKTGSPFEASRLWNPSYYLLRKTATRPAMAISRGVAGFGQGCLSAIDQFWASFTSAGAILAAPWKLWTRLLDAADQSYQREFAQRDERVARFSTEEETPIQHVEHAVLDRRRTAWTFAAITGVVGVVLTFILQFSQPRTSTEAAESRVATNRKRPKLDVPLKTSTLLTTLEEERSHHRVPPPAPQEPLPIPDEPRTELTRSEVEVPMPPELDVRWIAIRREHQRLVEEPSEEFVVRSERPVLERVDREDGDDWNRSLPEQESHGQTLAASYASRLHPLDRDRVQRELDSKSPPETAPLADSNIQLKIEKRAPKESSPGEPAVWELIVRNEGKNAIDRLQIEDLVPDARQVVNVAPLGIVVDRSVQWAIGPLQPGDEQTLRIEMAADAEGRMEAVSRVRSFAAVSFTTEVAGPKLVLEVESPEKLKDGDPCRIRYRIRNVGEADAENVVLREALPAELDHREGRSLDHEIGRLAAGESKEAQLTVHAAAPGVAAHFATLLANGKVQQSIEKKVEIVERPAPVARSTPRPVERPAARPSPRPKPAPAAIAPEICRPILASPECFPVLR